MSWASISVPTELRQGQRVDHAHRQGRLEGRHLLDRRATAEGRARPGLGLPRRTVAVAEAGGFEGQHPLGLPHVGPREGLQGRDLVERQPGEDAQVATDVAVIDVDPVLVPVVGAGLGRVEPDRARRGLAHLLAVGCGDEGDRHRVGVPLGHAPDQVDARGDVAPLVGAPDLDEAVLRLGQVEEVVGLEEGVVELQEGHALLQALLDRGARQHLADGHVAADVAEEVHVVEPEQPVAVVDHEAPGEVQVALELGLQGPLVDLDLLPREQLALRGATRRVPDPRGPAAHQHDRAMPRALEVGHAHDQGQRSGVERGRGAVPAHVEAARRSAQPGFEVGGAVGEKSALAEDLEGVHSPPLSPESPRIT